MQNYRNDTMSYNNYRQSMARNVDNARRDMREMRDTKDTRNSRDFLDDMPLAMAYVPWQKWQNIYDAEKGFHHGTIFQELHLPFEGVGGCQK